MIKIALQGQKKKKTEGRFNGFVFKSLKRKNLSCLLFRRKSTNM